MLEKTEAAACTHRRVTHGHGAIYECLDCGAQVPPEHMRTMQAAEQAAPTSFGFLAWHVSVPDVGAPLPSCAHARLTQQTHTFYNHGAEPLEAH